MQDFKHELFHQKHKKYIITSLAYSDKVQFTYYMITYR